MKTPHPLIWLLSLLIIPLSAEAGFSLVGKCEGSGGVYVRNGRNGKDIKPALNAISNAAGKNIQVFSCYRSQSYQNGILKRRGCYPYGRRSCGQSVARVSAHTTTIATDIYPITSDKRRQCQIIARGRAVAGGGGVGTYPGGSGHFDLGRTRSWNKCAGVLGSGGGYRSGAVSRYRQARGGRSYASRRCYPTRRYPSCCGPIRRSRGLCSG